MTNVNNNAESVSRTAGSGDELLFCCAVEDLSDTDIAEEFLASSGLEFTTLTDTESGRTRHVIYCTDRRAAETAGDILGSPEDFWLEAGLSFAPPEFFTVEKKDWSEAWKKFFTIQHISETVVVKPTWLDYTPAQGESVIELDPGMSFGTGRHATTRFCIRMLDELAAENQDSSFLDAGCGSGILTVAAYKLGYRNLTAFDNDPGCLITTVENLELNDIPPEAVNLMESGLEDMMEHGCFDIVTANIMAHILVNNREIIARITGTGGYLILAGILTSEYPGVRDAFTETGFEELKSQDEDEWTGGLFRRV